MLFFTFCLLALVGIYAMLIGNLSSMLEANDESDVLMEKAFHSSNLLPY